MKLCVGSSETSTSFTKNKVILKDANEQFQTNQLHTAHAPLHSTRRKSPQRGPSKTPRAGVLTHGEEVAIDL